MKEKEDLLFYYIAFNITLILHYLNNNIHGLVPAL